MVLKLVSPVSFPLSTEEYFTSNALHWKMMVNHGALLRSMRMETTLEDNGGTVTPLVNCLFISFNRAWERKWYIMSPMKNPKRWFFWSNMKFSMCRDYTKIFSKIAPCAKGEKKYGNIQVIWTIILKISNLEAKLEIFKIIVRITCIFPYFFSPFAHGAILEKKIV